MDGRCPANTVVSHWALDDIDVGYLIDTYKERS
jgi:hypothetical protein